MAKLNYLNNEPIGMKNFPKVNVGVPVFNGGETLARALDSLVSQDYPNIEILISDNASTDDTWEICQDFSSRYEHIKIFRHEENQGAVKNAAFVSSNATGEYFFLAHHDDWRESDWVSVMVDVLESDPNAVVALGPSNIYGSNSDVKAELTFNNRLKPSRLPLILLLVFILFKPTPFLGHVKFNFFVLGLIRRELAQKVFEVQGLYYRRK